MAMLNNQRVIWVHMASNMGQYWERMGKQRPKYLKKSCVEFTSRIIQRSDEENSPAVKNP